MNIVKCMTEERVYEKDCKIVTDSRRVAEYFSKDHKNVLQSIQNLECSEDFSRLNFQPSTYKDDRGKKQPECIMTRNGFMFLVMRFTGKKAARIQEGFILAFEYMENLIKERFIGIHDVHFLTDAIKDAHDPCNFYHYSNEFDMINRVVIGMTAKQFKEKHDIEGNSIRPYLTALQLFAINSLQRWNTDLIEIGYDYRARKEKLEKRRDKIFAKPPKELSEPVKLLTSKIPA